MRVCECVCVYIGSDRPLCRSEEHTSELQSHLNLVCRLLLANKNTHTHTHTHTHTTTHTHTHTHTRTHTCRSTTHSPRHTTPHTHTHTFFFNDTATTEIYTLSLHDALPI